MWVRTQDKDNLINCFSFGIVEDRYQVWADDIPGRGFNIIASYDTKEQATKVMDMIQEHIENTHFDSLSCNYLTGAGNVQVPFQTAKAVFQMPAISEVEAMLSKEKEWTVEEILKREG